MPEEFVNATITCNFGFVFHENSVREIIVTSSFSKSFGFEMFFFIHSKPQSRRFVFVKIHFCDGLVCKFGRPNRLKLRYVLSNYKLTLVCLNTFGEVEGHVCI